MVTRVAFGVRVLNGGDHLEEALASILAQSYRDFGVVVMDNCSTDATPQIGRRFAAADPRVRYRRNTETVGMVDNWRRAFDAAREEFGDFEYFAFGSDHDIWEPEWLESLIGELDGDETAVLAYPLTKPIRPDGTPFDDPMTRRQWDSTALTDPVERVRQVALGSVRPGNTMHGLFRADALERCGVVQATLAADRVLMLQLAALGTFKQIPRELWLRRFWDHARPSQRRRMFTGGTRAYAYLPISLVHAGILFRWAVLEGRARPEVSRIRGVAVTAAYLTARVERRVERRRRSLAKVRHKQSKRWKRRAYRAARRGLRLLRVAPAALRRLRRSLRRARRA